MSDERDPYGQALRAIRGFVADGRFRPGDPLTVQALAAELRLSPTPVREALAWLAGEGLIERRRGRGYRLPVLSAAEVVDLYQLEHILVRGSLSPPLRPDPSRLSALARRKPDELDLRTLLTTLVASAGNRALLGVHTRLADRMLPIRWVERQGGDDDRLIWDELRGALHHADVRQALGALDALLAVRTRRALEVARDLLPPVGQSEDID